MQAADDAAIPDGNEDTVWCLPLQLLVDFEDGRLLALRHIRVVPGIAIVPTILVGNFQTQLEGIVIAPLDQQDG